MRTTVSSRGQTAVPAAVRKRFKLTGRRFKLEWIIEGDVITLLPIPADPARAFRGALLGRYSGCSGTARENGRARGHVAERESPPCWNCPSSTAPPCLATDVGVRQRLPRVIGIQRPKERKTA